VPTYEFRCPKCAKEVEIQKSMSDESVPLCCEENCGNIEMVQIISKSSFHLKGLGWAAEGYSKTGVD
jgi:putative FmdB family regulatory protein